MFGLHIKIVVTTDDNCENILLLFNATFLKGIAFPCTVE